MNGSDTVYARCDELDVVFFRGIGFIYYSLMLSLFCWYVRCGACDSDSPHCNRSQQIPIALQEYGLLRTVSHFNLFPILLSDSSSDEWAYWTINARTECYVTKPVSAVKYALRSLSPEIPPFLRLFNHVNSARCYTVAHTHTYAAIGLDMHQIRLPTFSLILLKHFDYGLLEITHFTATLRYRHRDPSLFRWHQQRSNEYFSSSSAITATINPVCAMHCVKIERGTSKLRNYVNEN